MKFYDTREKQQVLKNCKKLKGKSVSISNDYAKETVDVRRKLWASASAERAKGAKVFLIDDKLKVNDKLYVWDHENNARLLLHHRDKNKHRAQRTDDRRDDSGPSGSPSDSPGTSTIS